MPTVAVDGLRVDYTDAGTGLPLVFVSGVFGSAEWFWYQESGLSDRYRVVGCGLRAARGRVAYTLDLLASDIIRLLDRLRIHSAVVIGHTLGAMVALQVAATYPDRTLAVGLISAAPSFSAVSDEDIVQHLSPGDIRQESMFVRLWRTLTGTGSTPKIDAADHLAFLARHGAAVDRATLKARLNLLQHDDVTPLLAEVDVPAIVIAGARDWSKILSGSQLIDYGLPDSQLEVLEDADHFCFYTHHDAFNAVLDDFVSHEVPRL